MCRRALRSVPNLGYTERIRALAFDLYTNECESSFVYEKICSNCLLLMYRLNKNNFSLRLAYLVKSFSRIPDGRIHSQRLTQADNHP